ncbi:hypothetical protein E2C01_027005 [Portunus trituberculatus]|uniref:Uncharacterized protein n=1 Tax=Portunus trituberculatus TaxID=210409 RepID=A0A5B7EK06_PORTR|nr:hypothetical protein [Portunus trituberculatus]
MVKPQGHCVLLPSEIPQGTLFIQSHQRHSLRNTQSLPRVPCQCNVCNCLTDTWRGTHCTMLTEFLPA